MIFRLWFPVLLLTFFTAAGAAPAELSPQQRALHVLNRLGYGPRPGDLDRVMAMGVDRYIAQQLSPDTIPQSPAVQQQLAALQTLALTPQQLFLDFGPPTLRAAGTDDAARKAAQEHSRIPVQQATAARLIRALESPRQLQEVMAEFWFNHFNVFEGKGLDHVYVGNYEQNAIRPYALGHFRDLLGATAKHPAMLFYLDNWQSTAPGFHPPHARKNAPTGLNENYAREVMELHTLGVDGGYTQKDVTELARILTGWTFLPRGNRRIEGGVFVFDARRHDFGDKTFLGRHFHGGGEEEGERALDMLAASPATAHHISYELAQFFVADNPPPALVGRLSKTFIDTHGDIREVLRTLFASAEFWAPENDGNKFKTPYQYVVSSLRALGYHVTNFKPAMGAVAQLGMPIYGCPTPDGYKNTEEAWMNPDAMIHRVNLAVSFVNGGARFSRAPDEDEQAPPKDKFVPPDPAVLLATLGNPFSLKTSEAYAAAPPRLRAALLLGSPEFMRR
ncbi:MAG: DUF1800 domain-containing protein [Stenotrophobium sp.]